MAVLGTLLIGWLVSRLEQAMTYHPTPLTGIAPGRFGWDGLDPASNRLTRDSWKS